MLVFLVALGVWELWAGAANSFFVPKASSVAERAWDVWPTPEFLSEVGQSMKRYVVGFAIAAVIGIASASWSGHLTLPGARSIPSSSVYEPCPRLRSCQPHPHPRLRRRLAHRGHRFRPVFSDPRQHCQWGARYSTGSEGYRLDAARRSGERIARIYLPAASPSIMAGLRFAVSLGLVLVIVTEFRGEPNGLGNYLVIQQSTFDYPAMYAGHLFLGLLGYVLNRLFLVAERRLLAWHYGAAGE